MKWIDILLNYILISEITENLRTIVVPDNGKFSFLTTWEYDSWNRLMKMHYPDGEELTYSYDTGGNMTTMKAEKGSHNYNYVNQILWFKSNDAEIAEHETLYGGPTTNRYSYDNRYQLISAEGTHQGFNKQHKYNLTMEYGATGKILRKTQNNQWRKADGDWNSDAETTVDYRYTYDGQKPHAVSSIIDNNTETLHTFTYDASGNNLLETNSKASSDRQMVWTEDNRLASIKARGNISHYLYDANGIRTLKMSSSSFNISVNGVEAGSSAVDGNFTIYANPYAVVRKNQYTKHYFLGTQRILTKIGNSEVEKTFYEGYAENIVPNVDYQGKQDDLENKLVLNNELLNVGWYRETRGRIPSQHIKHYLRSKEYGGQSGVNPWGNDDNSSDNNQSQNAEDKQYYFHPDHLGSTNYLTDVTGEAYQHVAYLPWGEVFVEQRNTQSSRNTFLYTGKELDEETGLYYYEQRYYDPNKSTFLGVDQLTDKYPHISGFAYVANNPMILVDPDGRDWYQSESGGLIYRDGDEQQITIKGEEFENVGTSVSVGTDDGEYINYYQNVPISISNEPVNAQRTVLNNKSLKNQLLSKNSPLSDKSQAKLMQQSVNNTINTDGVNVAVGTISVPAIVIGGAELVAAGPMILSYGSIGLRTLGQYGARGYISGNQAMCKVWTWSNYSKWGSFATGVGTSFAPTGTQSSLYINNDYFYTLGEFSGSLIELIKERKK